MNISVGMGEIKVSKKPGDVLISPGLGSCIGLSCYDPKSGVAGVAHIVLPDSTAFKGKPNFMPGKYADTAVEELLAQLKKLGVNDPSDLLVVMAGGSQMFTLDKGSSVLNIGMRNKIAVNAMISKCKLNLLASDTGGNKGRTLRLDVESGVTYIRSIGDKEKILGGNICQKF